MDIHFTSDPHFGHKNICKGVTNWKDSDDKCRDFKSVEEMNTAIIEGINKTVKENDILYCLGDWSFGGIENIWNFRKQIHCKNIHLVLGNHDHHIDNNRILPNCYIDENLGMIDGSPKYQYNDGRDDLFKVWARDIFSSVNYVLIKKIGGIEMTLCHYAMRTWDKAHHGSWMLHGHSHGSLPQYSAVKGYPTKNSEIYRTMDVGVDVIYSLTGEYRPISLDELKSMFKDRPALLVDHHNSKTN